MKLPFSNDGELQPSTNRSNVSSLMLLMEDNWINLFWELIINSVFNSWYSVFETCTFFDVDSSLILILLTF